MTETASEERLGEPAGRPAASDSTIDETELRALREAGRAWATVPRAMGAAGPPINPDLDAQEARGSRPGDRYVRGVRSRRQGLEKVAPGHLQATLRASEPTRTGMRGGIARLRRVILGKPLASAQFVHERLSKKKAMAVLSSDALSSVAYGPEAIIAALAVAGTTAFNWLLPVTGAILVLLVALILSYRQVIKAYPNAGGSYVVAKENLGIRYGLVAGSALVTDYILTVSVSVASGVAAITSAVPGSDRYTVEMCVGIIVLIILGNLRGIQESASLFAIPTYLFLISMFGMIAVIFFKLATGGLHTASAPAVHASQSFSAFVVLRAFASGCASLTGVEALSNSVGAFKPVEWRNARLTLTMMGVLLGGMLLGVAVCSHLLGYTVKADETLVSQLGRAAFGGNSPAYFFLMFSVTSVLVLAANTSFTGFPRLFYFMASDGYAPRQFKRMGDRLAYSNGILVLGVLAIILEVAFRGQTDALLPLYTIGVFLAFTMAQAGMVSRWLRRRESGWHVGMAVNLAGMIMTGVVFVVVAWEKAPQGAWVVVVIIPILVALFAAIHRHYLEMSSRLMTETPTSPDRVNAVVVVPVADLNALALQSLALARTISDSVVAVHINDDPDEITRLRVKWAAWGDHVPLEIIESPYRTMLSPLLKYIDALDRQRQGDTIVVVLPELVATRWWQHLLHNQTALRIKAALLFRPGTVVVSVPYHLRRYARARRSLRARQSGDEL